MSPLVAAFVVPLIAGVQPPKVEQAPPPRDVLLEKLIRTINDDPDKLHWEHTPSVWRLSRVGEPAIPRMLDLMLTDDEDTRMRAELVLLKVTGNLHRFRPGWQGSEDEQRFRDFWKAHGDLSWKGSYENRERAVKAWREWYAKGCPLPGK